MAYTRFLLVLVMLFSYVNVLAEEEGTVPTDLRVVMRDHSYRMGDVMPMHITFTLPTGKKIDEESLPLVGRVKHWLDIQSIQFTQEKQQVRLDINWQLFGTVEISQALKTPKLVFKTKDPEAQTIVIPQQTFYYSSMLPKPPLKDVERKPDQTPPYFETAKPLTLCVIGLGLLALCGFIWLWLKDKISWLPYQAGPMTRLSRALKKQSILTATTFTLSQLREIHQALNASAGCSLYPNSLANLFTNAPYFESSKTEVEVFFNQSWQAFYADEKAAEAIDIKTTMTWVQQMAIAERLSKRRHNLHKVPVMSH